MAASAPRACLYSYCRSGRSTLIEQRDRHRSDSPIDQLPAYSGAHKITASQILAPLPEVLRHPVFRLLFEKTSVRVMGPQFLHLTDYVTRIELVENAHELPEVDVCHAQVAANYHHVLVVVALRWSTEIRRAGYNNGVVAQRIDQHKLIVDVLVFVEAGQFFADEILQVVLLQLGAGGDHSVVDVIDLVFDIRLKILVENCVTERVVLSQEHIEKELVEVESKGHAEDALRGIHQVRIPMQGLKRFVAVPWTEECEHPIAWRE